MKDEEEIMYNKIVIFLAALLSAKIGFSQNLATTHSMVEDSLKVLLNESLEVSKAELSYHLGVVYGNIHSVANANKIDQKTFDSLDESLGFPFSRAFKKLDLSEIPSTDLAITAVDGDHSKLSDEKFCLYKGVVVGEVLAGNRKNKATYASMSGLNRTMEVCTPISRKMTEEANINNSSRENRKPWTINESSEKKSTVNRQ